MAIESPMLRLLRIVRMPGLPREQSFVLEKLVPGINVLYGPNEIGKTTVADAIGMLLHGRPGGGREELEALVGIGEACHEVCYINGRFDPEPTHRLPADHTRYRLSLHELLRAEDPNRDFAELILRESAGGYDIGRAKAELDFRDSPPPTNIAEYTRYTTCKSRLKEARKAAGDPGEMERELDRLQKDKRKVEREVGTADALEAALEYAANASSLNGLRSELEALPDALASMTGDEYDRLEALRKERKTLEGELEDARRGLDQAERDMEQTRLSGPVPDKLLRELADKIDAMKGAGRDIDSLQRRLIGLKRKLEETEKPLGATVDPAALGEVDVALVDRAGKVARRLADLHVREEELRTVTDIHPEDAPETGADELRNAARFLVRWLASPEPRQSGRRKLDLAGAVLSVVAGVSGVALLFFGKTGWPAAAVGVAVLAAGLILVSGILKARSAVGEGAFHRGEFERTGLEPPRSWSREGVMHRLEEIEDALAGAR
ncbi:MAG: AAA family ATPase, partial [Candidatus Fermentibacterota bacterium]